MNELRIETYTMRGAALGVENPLPPLVSPKSVAEGAKVHENVSQDDRKHMGYGTLDAALPHRMQDGYDRVKKPRGFRVAVLENDALRATFLLELGGRLWSLFHKPSQRELLHVNPVFQPANLAVRDAWFCGGVEWNIGVVGHTPYTCSPLHAARVRGDNGTPVLRLYEWDRTRGTPYQMDFWLRDGSPFLFARMRIINPHDREVPMYWWSNISVHEAPGVRVVVPADRAFNFGYQGQMMMVPIPVWEGVDVTYPTHNKHAADYFYRIPDGHRPWITALDQNGRGLFQASTGLLKARKLFVWGMGVGGRRWQEFLSVPSSLYIEIQAGLGRTQAECLPMPPHSTWEWLEAYGLMEADPKATHGTDWRAAQQCVESRIDAMLPQPWLEEELKRSAKMADRPVEDVVQRGSGWGALERRRRIQDSQKPFCSDALVFDDASLTGDQAPWVALLDKGAFPLSEPSESPGAWMVQPEWRERLNASIRQGRSDHWLAWLHLGVMHYHHRDVAAARQAWERSLELAPSVWAYRNLAVLAQHEGRKADAAELMLKAQRMMPNLAVLTIEAGNALMDAGRAKDYLALLPSLSPEVRRNDRIRILEARAAMETGDLDTVQKILSSEMELANLREGEVILSDLWFGVHERRLAAKENVPIDDKLRARVRKECPPPAWIDFRMSTAAGPGQ